MHQAFNCSSLTDKSEKKKAKLPIIYLLINISSSEFDQIMEGICRNIGLYGRAVYDFLEIFEYCCWGIGDKQPN